MMAPEETMDTAARTLRTGPKIGRAVGTPAELTPALPGSEPDSVVYGMEVEDRELLAPLGQVPPPPACILQRFPPGEYVWRWLSVSGVRAHGSRNYVTVSPTARERDLIDSGRDQPPGVHVDAENKVKWREDAWLAVIPRRLYERRVKEKRARTAAQTALSKDRSPLAEAMARHGGTLREYSVDSRRSADVDD